MLHLEEDAPRRAATHVATMVERRATGEPLQYVVGAWGFRTLDLLVDRRVLIPRPETEVTVEVALGEGRRIGPPLLAVDLGTGSGAIALSLAVEAGADVWATDVSAGALAVARANLAGICGEAATRVRLAEGDWYTALPPELMRRVQLIVANPPYVAEVDQLPADVADWEPYEALVAGLRGTEDIEAVVADAPAWLARPGALVVELAPHQARAAMALACAAGFDEIDVHRDLSGRERVLVARVLGAPVL